MRNSNNTKRFQIAYLRSSAACAIAMVVLISGCASVTTDQYVHTATDAIRCGQYHSAYYQDASDAFPMDLEGVILAPEFARSKFKGRWSQLHGSFFIVARKLHNLEIQTVELSSPDKNASRTLDVNLTTKLKEISHSKLWQNTVRLELPKDLFSGAETLTVNVTWKDLKTGERHQSEFELKRDRRRTTVFST